MCCVTSCQMRWHRECRRGQRWRRRKPGGHPNYRHWAPAIRRGRTGAEECQQPANNTPRGRGQSRHKQRTVRHARRKLTSATPAALVYLKLRARPAPRLVHPPRKLPIACATHCTGKTSDTEGNEIRPEGLGCLVCARHNLLFLPLRGGTVYCRETTEVRNFVRRDSGD